MFSPRHKPTLAGAILGTLCALLFAAAAGVHEVQASPAKAASAVVQAVGAGR